ncbi:MAG: DUF4351 domain-containing protein [Clostridiaceae bacterium]|nr:DUF4351 domain-containing protein [Clostridiaceae bacterium]
MNCQVSYMVEIWRNILKKTDKKEARRKDFKLPVIIPCVLYNGSEKWTAKRSFKETLYEYEQFGELVIDFKFGVLAEDMRIKIEQLDVETLDIIVYEMLDYDSLEDLYKHLK